MNEIDDASVDRLLDVIHETYHYDFRGYARPSLCRRVQSAVARFGLSTIDELTSSIVRRPGAFGDVLSHLTVQVSDMFRDPAYFRYFREEIVPVLRTYPSRKLWIAGCSTGEEAYSFAIILKEESLLARTLIYATDIHGRSLRAAEAGVYGLERIRTFSENHRKTGARISLSEHYTAGPHGAVFDRSLRECLVFADHSLATDAVFAEVQVVSCRNVLIYFGPELQHRALGLFERSLVRQGWLGLGPRETVEFSPVRDAFHAGPERWYRKRDRR